LILDPIVFPDSLALDPEAFGEGAAAAGEEVVVTEVWPSVFLSNVINATAEIIRATEKRKQARFLQPPTQRMNRSSPVLSLFRA
jgi:hypothetical protein